MVFGALGLEKESTGIAVKWGKTDPESYSGPGAQERGAVFRQTREGKVSQKM